MMTKDLHNKTILYFKNFFYKNFHFKKINIYDLNFS